MIKVATMLGEALFDDRDWDLAYHPWSAGGGGKYLWGTWKGKKDFAHRIIAKRYGLNGRIDHEDRNKINNQFHNLREATCAQNSSNTAKQKNNTSGFRGVGRCSKTGNWRAYIIVNYIFNHIGQYANIEDAARAYDKEAIKHFGDRAGELNFPKE